MIKKFINEVNGEKAKCINVLGDLLRQLIWFMEWLNKKTQI
jgi:hypothetical protein